MRNALKRRKKRDARSEEDEEKYESQGVLTIIRITKTIIVIKESFIIITVDTCHCFLCILLPRIGCHALLDRVSTLSF